jgi:hypothetical protein
MSGKRYFIKYRDELGSEVILHMPSHYDLEDTKKAYVRLNYHLMESEITSLDSSRVEKVELQSGISWIDCKYNGKAPDSWLNMGGNDDQSTN